MFDDAEFRKQGWCLCALQLKYLSFTTKDLIHVVDQFAVL